MENTFKNKEENLNSSDKHKELIDNNILFGVMQEIYSLKDYPRMQIFITHGFLELIVNNLIKKKAKNGKKIARDSRSYTYSHQILILNEIGSISNELYKILDWFRKLRNRAAHESLFEITQNDLAKLKINGEKAEISKFTDLCRYLIIYLTNDHLEILGPIISPTFTDWENKFNT